MFKQFVEDNFVWFVSIMFVLIIILGVLIVLTVFKTNEQAVIVDNSPVDFTSMSTEDVYKVYDETSILTEINSKAFKELQKRKYFEQGKLKKEREALEIYNKYKNK